MIYLCKQVVIILLQAKHSSDASSEASEELASEPRVEIESPVGSAHGSHPSAHVACEVASGSERGEVTDADSADSSRGGQGSSARNLNYKLRLRQIRDRVFADKRAGSLAPEAFSNNFKCYLMR